MNTSSMPALFIGHGSPMNAIEDNDFTASLKQLGSQLPRPEAILCVSAHWQTAGTQVLVQDAPETIHDFYGFPRELNEFRYPAPGAVKQARLAVEALVGIGARENSKWGLDHGTWSVLTHLYPKADIPVFQVSLDRHLPMDKHQVIGALLAPLRDQGILILGSGNIVHNLGLYDADPDAKPYDWAVKFDAAVKKVLLAHDATALNHPETISPEMARLAMPTTEHYLPLLYVAGASRPTDRLSFPYEGLQNASMSMRMVLFQDGGDQ